MNPQQLPLAGLPLRDSATFESFFAGKNTQVVSVLQAMITGDYPEQFIFLWGEAGAGISHLLQACCHSAAEQQLASMYIDLQHKADYSPQMLEALEHFQLICIDDIDLILDDPQWQQAIFHLYNRLRDSDRQLIVTAHQPPQTLDILPDLRSRLSWGLCFQVQSLSDEEKIQALQLRAHNRGFELSGEVAQFILRRVPRDMKQLFIIFDTLDEAAIQAQRKLTIPFVKHVLGV